MLLASEDAARSDEAPTLHHSHGWSMPDITPEKVWGYQIAQGSRNVLNWLSSPSVEPQTLRRKLKFPEVYPAFATAGRTWLWLSTILSCIFSCSLTCHEHNHQMLHFPAHSARTHILCAHMCACTHTRREGSFFFHPDTFCESGSVYATRLEMIM